MKNGSGFLIGIALNPSLNFGRMAIFMILILIYKHGVGVGVFPSLCRSLGFFLQCFLVVSIEVIHILG